MDGEEKQKSCLRQLCAIYFALAILTILGAGSVLLLTRCDNPVNKTP